MAFTIRDFHDLLDLLNMHPDWRLQLQRVLFPEWPEMRRALEELAESRKRMDALIERIDMRLEKSIGEASSDHQRIREEMRDGFAEAAAERDRRFAEATTDRGRIREEMRDGFAEATTDRGRIREEMRDGFAKATTDRGRIREEMRDGFAEAAADRDRRFAEAAADRDRRFAEAAADRDRRFAEAAADRESIRRDVRDLKGKAQEDFYRSRAVAVFGRLLTRGHEVAEVVADRLQEAFQAGHISDREYDAVLAADLLWGGRLRGTEDEVVLVLEASWRVEPHDVQRAAERAAILRRMGLNAIPVAAGQEWPDDVEEQAQQAGVVIIRDGSLRKASWQAAVKVQ